MTNINPTVVVVGSYNVGLTMQVPSFPAPGETVVGSNFAEGPGGKGSNQAIAAARLDAESRFVGRTGDDRYAKEAFSLWHHEKISVDNVKRDENHHTGVGFVIVNEQGENEITVAPGANAELSRDDVHRPAKAIESADSLLVQLEIKDEPVEAAVDIAAIAGLDVVCNPAPARKVPDSILKHVDYLTPNEHEARTLAGSDDNATDEEVAQKLLDLGVETVVLTRGADGAFLLSK